MRTVEMETTNQTPTSKCNSRDMKRYGSREHNCGPLHLKFIK